MESRSLVRESEQPLRVFFSYAHEDEQLRDELEAQLSFLRRAGAVDTWHDRKIGPGDDWKGEIDRHLKEADVILLLVSPAFGESDYCWDVETKLALRRHHAGEARTVPVILRPVEGWQDTPLGELQAVPRDGKPVTLWRRKDEGYREVVRGLRDLLKEGAKPSPRKEKERVTWTLTVARPLAEFSNSELADLALRVRAYARDLDLELLVAEEGSARLKLRSSAEAFEAVRAAHAGGALDGILEQRVTELGEPIGALIRIETSVTDQMIEPSLTYLPDTFGGEGRSTGMPPLVMGMAFAPENWLQPGFKLGYSPADGPPSAEEQSILQGRLARYLNTLLVVRGENLHVSLSPLKEKSGLPEPLRKTELGRDLLAQDVVLKYSTACLLYPASDSGREFWDRVEGLASADGSLESCMRVWVVPGSVTLNESMDQGLAHVDIKRLSPEVRCESDYEALAALRGREGVRLEARVDTQVLDAFREAILPRIQEEVSTGSRFGILRQVLSVLVMAAWFRKSSLAPQLREAGLLDSDDTERFKLNVVGDEADELHRQYLELFKDGVWRFGRSEYDLTQKCVRRRVLVAGGICADIR